MPPETLSSLDRSFLDVETPTAHMHVGWAAVFDPPAEGPRPTFAQLRDHVGARLSRAPRYRQRLAPVPLGLGNPAWVDDECFELSRHVREGTGASLATLVDDVMSLPLRPGQPLWELWIAPKLEDGRIGVVGKAHHCMVDGVAAVELASLMLDPTPDAAADADGWRPEPEPGPAALVGAAVRERAGAVAGLAGAGARVVTSPRRALEAPAIVARAARALARAGAPARPDPALNAPISPRRHLAYAERPLPELRRAGRRFGATVNDVLLAASAGALRELARRRGERPRPLKAMVPVSVRGGDDGELGNRISFVFVELPCDDPDPRRRLRAVNAAMTRHKVARDPEGADDLLRLAGLAPRPVQRALTQLVSSPLTFNLTVSNIPGPPGAMYMRGCELRAAYPVVPIADRHGVSIGMTTVAGRALVGVYADARSMPDADRLAEDIGDRIDDLDRPRPRPSAHPRAPAPVPV